MSTATLALAGTHHVSALSNRIGLTHRFYTGVLGMRPVIRTVNQDDPSMYHLFYGDGVGSPGSDMTVFDMPGAASELRGNNSITRTALRVHGERTLEWWAARLAAKGVAHTAVTTRDGRGVLDFDDAVGTPLSLVDDGGVLESHAWDASPVPPEHQVRGLGHVTLTVPKLERTERFLVDTLGLRHDREYADTDGLLTHVYVMGDGGAHAEVHVTVHPRLPRARYGSGGVHHVALRVPEGQSLADWRDRLDAAGYRHSGLVDRHYFMSLYVRETNGILFELATDGPGFDVDGPLDGERISLPPFLEARREEIESGLRPIA